MVQIEIAILFVVVLLLLSSAMRMRRKKSSCGMKSIMPMPKPNTSVSANPPKVMEGYEGSNMSVNMLDGAADAWNESTIAIGVDPATKASHKEWTTDFLRRTTTASPWTVLDHDINSNWRGLGWGKTWRDVYSASGSRVSESNDASDMPASVNLRWRSHDYPTMVNNRVSPWPPTNNQTYS